MSERIPTWMSGLLLPAGLVYGEAMRLRRWAFRHGLRRSYAPGIPVVCVGNLTVGGTGKTPMVAYVVRQLQAMGRNPMILTRGSNRATAKATRRCCWRNSPARR